MLNTTTSYFNRYQITFKVVERPQFQYIYLISLIWIQCVPILHINVSSCLLFPTGRPSTTKTKPFPQLNHPNVLKRSWSRDSEIWTLCIKVNKPGFMLAVRLEHKKEWNVREMWRVEPRSFYSSRYSYGEKKKTPVGLKPQIALFRSIYKFAFFGKLVTCWIRIKAHP